MCMSSAVYISEDRFWFAPMQIETGLKNSALEWITTPSRLGVCIERVRIEQVVLWNQLVWTYSKVNLHSLHIQVFNNLADK